tara:strand:+ start:106 stop:564 length:459 start_codon:yes stop_codon:yes gene_type:complete
MARSTLNDRIQTLANNIFTTLGSDLQPTVRSGKYSRDYRQRGKGSNDKYIRISYRPSRHDGLDLIASVIVAFARRNGLRSGWSINHIGPDDKELIISFTVDYGYKASTALTNLPTDYSAIKGFTAKTHSDLQLFGGQGFNAEDSARVVALLA